MHDKNFNEKFKFKYSLNCDEKELDYDLIMEAFGAKPQVGLRDLLDLKSQNLQLKRQLTASKSLSDLSKKEQLSKSPAIKSESLNNINVNFTDKSQKDYSLPPDDISTIIRQNVLEINSRDDAGSYQTKSEETNQTLAESKAEVDLMTNPQKNIDIKV